jgi:hypothetical protein
MRGRRCCRRRITDDSAAGGGGGGGGEGGVEDRERARVCAPAPRPRPPPSRAVSADEKPAALSPPRPSNRTLDSDNLDLQPNLCLLEFTRPPRASLRKTTPTHRDDEEDCSSSSPPALMSAAPVLRTLDGSTRRLTTTDKLRADQGPGGSARVVWEDTEPPPLTGVPSLLAAALPITPSSRHPFLGPTNSSNHPDRSTTPCDSLLQRWRCRARALAAARAVSWFGRTSASPLAFPSARLLASSLAGERTREP